MARILLLEPYNTGSHARWVASLARFSSHTIHTLTLPGRFWKWRMHGGAVTLARNWLASPWQPDLLLATDMLDLTTFLALTRHQLAGVPSAVYFHENQLTYPSIPGTKRDLHYGFINYATMLAADHVFFNSAFHRSAFFDELPRLLKHFPDYTELETINVLKQRSEVLPLGLDLKALDESEGKAQHSGPLRIVWNHRWEYDKQPEMFLEALYKLQRRGLSFKVILLGESFQQRPEEFLEAQERLAHHIEHVGYVSSRDEYARLLHAADVQVSTAIQDFFGGSTCEAIYCGCHPLLPDRLNYPALVPTEVHAQSLYRDFDDLVDKLSRACERPEHIRRSEGFHTHVEQFDWRNIIVRYDDAFQTIIDRGPMSETFEAS